MGFALEQEHKNYYLNMLMNNGYSPTDAYRTYHSFMREYDFSHEELKDLISSFESQKQKEEVLCG